MAAGLSATPIELKSGIGSRINGGDGGFCWPSAVDEEEVVVVPPRWAGTEKSMLERVEPAALMRLVIFVGLEEVFLGSFFLIWFWEANNEMLNERFECDLVLFFVDIVGLVVGDG